ncbi:hypothetical protein E4T39_02413 [Aureobasidium subglaciale]|nr:hypothetical protein E4T39_02413 [Aureobasidium subglaciale]
MAEVVGLVVGVAGFSLQIADGIKKLVDFCQAVKDTPTELEDAIGDLKLLAEQYELIDRQVNASPSRNVVIEGILERASRACNNLETLLAEMNIEVKRKRIPGSIKAALKKATIQRFEMRVERTLRTLHLAYTDYCSDFSALVLQETRSIQQGVQSLLATTPHIYATAAHVSAMAPQVDMILVGSNSSPTSSMAQSVTTGSHITTARSQWQRQRQNTFSLKMRLPWLTRRAYDLVFMQSTNGWNIMFRT